MFGKFGDMMGKLQEMKQKAEEVKQKLETSEIGVEGAGGDIRITISGSRRIRKIDIAPALQHGSKSDLEEKLAATLNKAMEAADKMNEEEMKRAAGGLLPGL